MAGRPEREAEELEAGQLERAVADIVLAQPAADDEERRRTEAFTANALAACARYNREASKLAQRHERFRQEFGQERITSWATDQLNERAAPPPDSGS